jgi:predicted SnoaL-like aldol condensation-catalyzing enzyme
MRNAVAIVLAVAMLATATVIALEFGALLRAGPQSTAPGPNGADSADRERIVVAFYDAANAVLDGQTTGTLPAIISPAVVTHRGGEAMRGADALATYFAGLRQPSGMTLDLVRIVDNGADIAAFVEARLPSEADRVGEPGPFLWRTIELFRIERGMIADYWPGEVGQALPLPLAAATVPAKPGDTGVSLTRIALGPDAEAVTLNAPHPHLLLVESGAFAATRETDLFVARAGERVFSRIPAAPGNEEILRLGDALLLTDGAGPTIRNPQEPIASALSFLIAPGARLYSQVRALPTDRVTVMGMHDPSQIGQTMTWRSGAASETLAVGMLPGGGWQTSAVALRGEPLVLDPGQSISPLPPGTVRLAIVRSGTASVTGLGAADGSGLRPGLPERRNVEEGLIWAGEAFTIDAGTAPRIANAGATRLDMLLVEIAPTGGRTAASPEAR